MYLCCLQRIGYLAATQSFHDDTDVIMLTTNMIRKDLSSQHQYDAGLALDGLACFMTPDLARDLANDVLTLVCCVTCLWSSKPVAPYLAVNMYPDKLYQGDLRI